jgi:acetylornithine/N-succinyldiaminopimelate aminotransferase
MDFMNYNVKPDIVSMAKGIGGGMPIGAICCTNKVAAAMGAGTHGSTFGGSPVSCAGAYAQVKEILDRKLADNAAKVGDYFAKKLESLPHVKEVRHAGLLVGVEFDVPKALDIKHGCTDRKMLVTAIGTSVIRMVPPLIVTEQDCDKAYEILKAAVEGVTK